MSYQRLNHVTKNIFKFQILLTLSLFFMNIFYTALKTQHINGKERKNYKIIKMSQEDIFLKEEYYFFSGYMASLHCKCALTQWGERGAY